MLRKEKILVHSGHGGERSQIAHSNHLSNKQVRVANKYSKYNNVRLTQLSFFVSVWSAVESEYSICPCSYCLCRLQCPIRRICSVYRCQVRLVFKGSRYCPPSNILISLLAISKETKTAWCIHMYLHYP
jgi:hypothetical protein